MQPASQNRLMLFAHSAVFATLPNGAIKRIAELRQNDVFPNSEESNETRIIHVKVAISSVDGSKVAF